MKFYATGVKTIKENAIDAKTGKKKEVTRSASVIIVPDDSQPWQSRLEAVNHVKSIQGISDFDVRPCGGKVFDNGSTMTKNAKARKAKLTAQNKRNAAKNKRNKKN